MLSAHFGSHAFVKMQAAAWFFEDQLAVDPWTMWLHMRWPARAIAIALLVMSAWSIGVMLDRWFAFRLARRHSRQFAPAAAGALREGRLAEAIRAAESNRKSHLARVVTSGLQEFLRHGDSAATPEEKIEVSRRALERTELIVHAELERGLGMLASIGSSAPFVGLLGTVVGIIDAFASMQKNQTTGLSAVAGGISEALMTTALGLFVAIPAVMMFNYFTNRIKAFDVEMNNSSSELVDYFLKKQIASRRN